MPQSNAMDSFYRSEVSRMLPRRKEFVVQDLQEEIRKLKLRIDLLTKERDQLEELVGDLQQELSRGPQVSER